MTRPSCDVITLLGSSAAINARKTWGDVAPPIAKYQGRTGRHVLKDVADQSENRNGQPPSGEESVVDTGLEGKSLGNVSRGEPIFTEPKIGFSAVDVSATAASMAAGTLA
jgi:hypothetical protein